MNDSSINSFLCDGQNAATSGKLRHGSLFSGIGGFDLAAEWMGWENVFHCEWNEFGKKVLKHYWPKAISYEDITKTDFSIHRGTIDILTGGFPCQPYSQAGKRKGKEDERHLWPEMLRAIREIAPHYIVGENVYGLTNWNGGLVFNEVQTDLESEGYEVQPVILPACAVNAPHKRERIWFVAYNSNAGIESMQREWKNGVYGFKFITDTKKSNKQRDGLCKKQQERETGGQGSGTNGKRTSSNSDNTSRRRRIQNNIEQQPTKFKPISPSWERFPTQPPVCRRNDGLSSKLDGITFPKWRSESIKAYGNAIVPQVAYEIFKAIQIAEFDVNNLVCPTHGTKLYKHPNGMAYCSLCNYSIKWQTYEI